MSTTAEILGFTRDIEFTQLGGLSYPDPVQVQNHFSFQNSTIDVYAMGPDRSLRVFNGKTRQHYYLIPTNPEIGDEVVLFTRTIHVCEPGLVETGGFGGFVRYGKDGDPFRDTVTRKSDDGSPHPEDARVCFSYLPGSWSVGCCYRVARVSA